jgi:hypothetical protein
METTVDAGIVLRKCAGLKFRGWLNEDVTLLTKRIGTEGAFQRVMPPHLFVLNEGAPLTVSPLSPLWGTPSYLLSYACYALPSALHSPATGHHPCQVTDFYFHEMRLRFRGEF